VRLGRLTAWSAAGSAAGVGLFAVLAASSTATKSSAVPPDTNVIVQPTSPASSTNPAQVPATVPPTVPTTVPAPQAPNDNSQSSVPAFDTPTTPTTQQPQFVQPPFDAPSTGRHHRDAAATSGGS